MKLNVHLECFTMRKDKVSSFILPEILVTNVEINSK